MHPVTVRRREMDRTLKRLETQSSVHKSKQWALGWKSIVWKTWSSKQIHQRVWRAQRWVKLEVGGGGRAGGSRADGGWGWGGPWLWLPVYIFNCVDNWRRLWAVALQGVFLMKTWTAGIQECSLLFISAHHSWTGSQSSCWAQWGSFQLGATAA